MILSKSAVKWCSKIEMLEFLNNTFLGFDVPLKVER